jgi:hypothetical protein
MRRAILIVAAAALLLPGCGDDNTPTTPTTPTRNVQDYSGTLQPSGSQRFVFFVSATGTVDLTLYSVRPAGLQTPALATPLRIGFGLPIGDGCTLQVAATTAPGLTTQVTLQTLAGTFCIGVEDESRLTAPTDFNVKAVFP